MGVGVTTLRAGEASGVLGGLEVGPVGCEDTRCSHPYPLGQNLITAILISLPAKYRLSPKVFSDTGNRGIPIPDANGH